MPEATLKNLSGKDAGSVSLAQAVFGAEPNAVVVREAYNAYMTNQRQGTHSTKTRHFVSGGGKKPWKQKGTGRARQGSIRATQWRGGATVFGPLPKDYREKVNRKKRQIAFRSLLSSLHSRGAIVFVETLEVADGTKTKEIVALRGKLGVTGKVLFVTADVAPNLFRAAKNLQSSATDPTRVEVAGAVSVFDLLTCDTLILSKDALAALEERLS